MINAKGEIIYTNAEIAYELGLTAATVNAVGKRIYGCRVPYWTLSEAQRIVEYIKSITIEEDTRRLVALHEMVESVMGGVMLDNTDTRQRIDKDIYYTQEKAGD